jgi:hypothetical protein
MSKPANIQWLRHPEAEDLVVSRLSELIHDMPAVQRFTSRLMTHTSSSLIDWVDHLVLADGPRPRGQLAEVGFEREEVPAEPGNVVYHHPGTCLPRILLRSGTDTPPGVTLAAAIQVEDIGFFLMTHDLAVPVDGMVSSPYRRARAWQEGEREFLVVERRGHAGFVPTLVSSDYAQRYLTAYEQWAARPRTFESDREGMIHTLNLVRSLASAMGSDAAAWIAFSAEREHWQRRSRAAQVQKARQDSLGLGWANHDHHTFRSSREVFPLLIQILEAFGFRPRERFYAGAEAGWGAQVMEQPTCRLAVFADVDLSPDEVTEDFGHRQLSPRHELGTVGLWCALHGESMLDAGLHHLAGRFDFEAVTADLAGWGIQMMHPFSNFSYLRQAFTQGERWDVAPNRLDRLLAAGQIDGQRRAQFAERGAIGSHLENIQRGEGFKGFNQQTISDIIRRTDPRAAVDAA